MKSEPMSWIELGIVIYIPNRLKSFTDKQRISTQVGVVFRPADLILDDDLQYVTTPPKLFPKDVSLGSSAIVEVSEQVEAAQIRIPKKVPGSSPE